MSNILITGATGFIGKVLQQRLHHLGYTCYILSTSVSNIAKNIYKWNPESEICEALPDIEFKVVINLAGASINDTRWNKAGKQLILDSRVKSTIFFGKIIKNFKIAPSQIISASAIGIYGINDNELKIENSLPGNDFAAKVCVDWENALQNFDSSQTKISIIRIGIVLGNEGGFYAKIKSLAKWKIAAALASGNQPVSWIHLDDLVEVFTELVEQKIDQGVYNAVTAFNSNKEITKKIAVINGQSFLMPAIPSFLLRILFGQKAEIFTGGTRVSNQKLVNAGFKYQFQTLDLVMNDLSRNSAK